jgi:hypothetical protein
MLGLLPVGHDGEAANFKVNLFAQFFLLILMVPNFAQPDWTMGHLWNKEKTTGVASAFEVEKLGGRRRTRVFGEDETLFKAPYGFFGRLELLFQLGLSLWALAYFLSTPIALVLIANPSIRSGIGNVVF